MQTVLLITEAFEQLTASTLRGRGMPDLPVVVLPHETEVMTYDELRPYVEKAFHEVIFPVFEATSHVADS